jgi:hypothetical protein
VIVCSHLRYRTQPTRSLHRRDEKTVIVRVISIRYATLIARDHGRCERALQGSFELPHLETLSSEREIRVCHSYNDFYRKTDFSSPTTVGPTTRNIPRSDRITRLSTVQPQWIVQNSKAPRLPSACPFSDSWTILIPDGIRTGIMSLRDCIRWTLRSVS